MNNLKIHENDSIHKAVNRAVFLAQEKLLTNNSKCVFAEVLLFNEEMVCRKTHLNIVRCSRWGY